MAAAYPLVLQHDSLQGLQLKATQAALDIRVDESIFAPHVNGGFAIQNRNLTQAAYFCCPIETKPMLHSITKLFLFSLCVVYDTALMAAPVIELQPADLVVFVAKHPQAVIQFTSPDRSCGYCVGADKKFDQAAAVFQGPRLVFARVQWSPWSKIPDFAPLLRVGGLPLQTVFKNGEDIGSVGGFSDSSEVFLVKIQKIVDQTSATSVLRAPELASANSGSPASSLALGVPSIQAVPVAEQALIKLQARSQMFGAASAYCAVEFPATAQLVQAAFVSWMEPRRKVLANADRVKRQRIHQFGDGDIIALEFEERNTVQSWQIQQLGVPSSERLTASDCMKLGQGIRALPPP